MMSSSAEELKFFLANQAQSFAGPLLSMLLEQRNSSSAGLAADCRDELIQVSSGALRQERRALLLFDSNGRLPAALASGSLFSGLLGNFEQCAQVEATSFCLAHIDYSRLFAATILRRQPLLEQYFGASAPTSTLVRFGFCAPARCNAQNITLIARQLLNSSHLWRSLSLDHVDCTHFGSYSGGESSGVSGGESELLSAAAAHHDGGWQSANSVACALLLLLGALLAALAATCLSTRPKANQTKSSTAAAAGKSKRKIFKLDLLVETFSISRNATALMKRRRKEKQQQQPTDLSIIDGLRAISSIWIILMHSHSFALQWLAFENVFTVRSVYDSVWLQWLANGTFSLDNFLLISGFLAQLKFLQAPPPDRGAKRATDQGQLAPLASTLVRRYLRLAPAMLMAILLSVAAFSSIITDSVSFNMASSTVMFNEWCQNNWPLNAALIQNLWRTEQLCFGHTWFVAIDFQLLLVTRLLLCLFATHLNRYHSDKDVSNNWRTLLPVCLVLIAVGQVASAALVYTKRLPAMPVIPAESAEKLNDYFRLVYIKPHYWLASYSMGMLLAALVSDDQNKTTKQDRKQQQTSNKHKSTLGALLVGYSRSAAPLLVQALILLSLYPFFSSPSNNDSDKSQGKHMSSTQATLYVLLARPLWSASVCALLHLMIREPRRDFIVRTLRYLLTLRLWIPLSRLSYVAYLLHPALMAALYGSTTSAFRYSTLLMVQFAVANVVFTYAAALLFHLLLEAPLKTLLLENYPYRLTTSCSLRPRRWAALFARRQEQPSAVNPVVSLQRTHNG